MQEALELDVAQFGLNCSSSTAAAAAARMLPQLQGLTADQVGQLLHTALARQPTNNALDHLRTATYHGWKLQQLPAKQLLPALRQAVLLGAQYPHHADDLLRLIRDWELPRSRIPADAVTGLTYAAMEAGSQQSYWWWLG